MVETYKHICPECTHSGRKPDDPYKCRYIHEGKFVDGWVRDENKNVILCPHFCEDAKWHIGQNAGRWSSLKPIPYIDAENHGVRVVLLEHNIMFPSIQRAMQWLNAKGKAKNEWANGAMFARARKIYKRARWYKLYGYHWAIVKKDERRGHKSCYQKPTNDT